MYLLEVWIRMIAEKIKFR